jgi:hypothetical protein
MVLGGGVDLEGRKGVRGFSSAGLVEAQVMQVIRSLRRRTRRIVMGRRRKAAAPAWSEWGSRRVRMAMPQSTAVMTGRINREGRRQRVMRTAAARDPRLAGPAQQKKVMAPARRRIKRGMTKVRRPALSLRASRMGVLLPNIVKRWTLS